MQPFLILAAKVALPTVDNDPRNFWLGCVAIREDGVQVSAKNGAVYANQEHYQVMPSSHAEGRVLRKLGKNGIVYVSRVAKLNGNLAMARPCPTCQIKLRAANVKKVYYSINESQYGIWFSDSDTDRIYNC